MTQSAISVLALIFSACSSPTPATSSSSNWVACNTIDECAAVSGAVACTGGYCVDSSGQKIESGGPDSKCDGMKCTLSCNPLDLNQLPVTPGDVLGVGKDSNGTTYMADEGASRATDRV